MDELSGWCVIWVPAHSGAPRMISNIADEKVATMTASAITDRGDKVIAICPEAELLKLGKPS